MTQTRLPPALTFRTVAEDGLRGATDVFRAALHEPPIPDDRWEQLTGFHIADRTFGAFDGDRLVGTTTSFPAALTLPGGGIVPTAGVTFVGVRSDYRRRGALTGLTRLQLADCAARGEVFAVLHASEPVIYGRFGYGLGTLVRTVTVRSPRAVPPRWPHAPTASRHRSSSRSWIRCCPTTPAVTA